MNRQTRRFRRLLLLALAILLAAVLAPLLATHDPYASVLKDALQPPGGDHWFGTDSLGRDLYSRVLYGARTSLAASLALVGASFALGSLLGMLAGWHGGWADAVIMRLSDMMLAFPGMVLALAIAGMLGGSMRSAVLALTAVSWTKYARLARSLTLKIRGQDYIAAAWASGARGRDILRRHLLPNAAATLAVTAAMDIGTMLLELAGLSFLGFGAQNPTAEWGAMLNEGRTYLSSAPWLMLFPGLAIFLAVSVFNLLGDSLRDLLDPRSAGGNPPPSPRRPAAKRKPDGTKAHRARKEPV